MTPAPQRRPPEIVRGQDIGFVVEQDGIPEREFKTRLATFFGTVAWVRVAYLAGVTYEAAGPMHIALCVRGQPGQNRIFAERVGQIFASIFGSHEHIDIIWITPDQTRLAQVCQPFYG